MPTAALNKRPPRLHVLLARDGVHAVVLRRGPSMQVCTVGWNRRTDTFQLGQWLKGKIYERRSDLSPDGRHFIYFALNGRWKSETRGSWTAVSRTPYLKAVGLWAKGDCWHGGGLFVDERRYWLNDGYGHDELGRPQHLERELRNPFGGSVGYEDLGVYYPRLLRDGWTLVERGSSPRPRDSRAKRAVFERALPHRWRLRKIAFETIDRPEGRGCYFDEHELVAPDGAIESHPEWEWADVDGKRVVWAEGGCLRAARVARKGLFGAKVLKDFGGMAFQTIKAPY